jgi:hypothetical protein
VDGPRWERLDEALSFGCDVAAGCGGERPENRLHEGVPRFDARVRLDSSEKSGEALYKESPDDNPEKLQLGAEAAATMFALASSLDHFKHPLESGLKVANMGAKTFRWETATPSKR